jgi:murein DD-endopeptidase MepM/ murein hydrolase activator NlpD
MLSYFGRTKTAHLGVALAVTGAALLVAAVAGADDIDHRLDRKRNSLEDAREKRAVLTSELDGSQERLDTLRNRVAELRNERAAVRESLVEAEREFAQAEGELVIARERLERSVSSLRDQLVEIYKLGDIPTVMILLDSGGLDEMTSRAEYLGAVEDSSGTIVDRVRDLREQKRATFEIVRDRRDEIAAREAELEALQVDLKGQEDALAAAIGRMDSRLADLRAAEVRLEGGVGRLQDEIAERLAAAQTEAAATGAVTAPTGPVQGESSSGMVWPVDGALTSLFGMRWGRLHAGIDIAAPGGTPIRAASSGVIVFAQSEAESGGYGNYTCVDHGGGLSTCYAHQSAFEVTSGSIEQGQVIGYVGNTGNSFGDHLHFEVRVNGEPVDPMGYL